MTDGGGSPMTLETLAALMTVYHEATTARLDKIDQKQEIANGRVSKTEQAVAVLMWTARAGGAALVVWLGVWLAKIL